MRIAVVHSYYRSDKPSGENRAVDQQVAQLRDVGHEVLTIAQRSDDLVADKSYAARSGFTVVTGAGASPHQALVRFGPQVVHLHNTFPNWGVRWLRHWGPRTVVTMHNFRTVCAAATLFRDGHECRDCLQMPVLPAIAHACYGNSRAQSLPLAISSSPRGALRSVIRQCAAVVCLNRAAAAIFEEAGARGRTKVVPNFVHQTPTEAPWQRQALFAGRLAPEKGVSQLVRSWPGDVPLHLVGAGPLRSQIEREVANNSMIEFAGPRPHTELILRLPSYACLIVPSLCAEGIPTVALEALAAAVPIVMSKHVAVAAEFEQAGAAITYDPSDVDSLRYAVRVVFASRDAMGKNARAMYLRNYSPIAWTREIEAVYAAVVAGSE
jgi:glycosyltransferase involved in cell wall biosynthesis